MILHLFLFRVNRPEQEEEAVDLQNNSDDGPAEQHHKHSSQEEAGGFRFVSLEEESERALQADDERKARDEQNLHGKQMVRSLDWTSAGFPLIYQDIVSFYIQV